MAISNNEILCLNLEATVTVEDETCTILSSKGVEQTTTTDFEVWLQKNGVESFITNDNQISSPPLEPDPFLSQICDTNALSDEVTHQVDCEIMICDNDNVNHRTAKIDSEKLTIIKVVHSTTDNNLNSLTKPNKTSAFKHEILLERTPINIEFNVAKDACNFIIKDADGNSLFLPQNIQVLDSSPSFTPNEQKITLLNFVSVAKNIDILLPQITTNCGSKIILCPLNDCSDAFFHISQAKIHSLKHIGIKPYKCNMPNCPWEFYTPFKLTRHKATHTKTKHFKCDFHDCNRGFTTVYNLNCHKKNHDKPATLVCPVNSCIKVFQTEKERRVHCKTHNVEEAPFICHISNCNKSFFTQTSLQTHARSHSHKESDVCCQYPDCGRMFETPYRLKEHLRTHTGQRPYVCNFEDCTWSFTTASKLRRHQSTHTKNRKFHCTIGNCTKSFLRPEHLKDHTLTHIGQRLFECEVCGSTFISKSSLYVHVKKCHPEKKQEMKKIIVTQPDEKQNSDALLEQAIQSLGVPSDIMLGTGLLPEDMLENENFSTVNLRDLD